MKYLTDLFDNHWGDKLKDRTDEVKAENQRLAKNREAQKWPTKEESQKASNTYSNARKAL